MTTPTRKPCSCGYNEPHFGDETCSWYNGQDPVSGKAAGEAQGFDDRAHFAAMDELAKDLQKLADSPLGDFLRAVVGGKKGRRRK